MEIKTYDPQDHYIKALIYGPSGAGKTRFAGTAEISKSVFASAEGGLLSIAALKPNYTDIKSVGDLVDMYNLLKKGEHKYDTVIIDSISEINEIIKSEIEKKNGRSMQLQDWGDLGKKIRDIFRKFRDLPMHVIFIAQEQYLTDADKIEKIVPALNGKSASDIAYFMDIVGYAHVDADGKEWIETGANRRYYTKDRSGKIGNTTPKDFEEWKKKVTTI